MERNATCSFTGHRKIESLTYHSIRRELKTALQSLIDNGYNIFQSGGALGFDLLAAEAVLTFKKKYPDICLNMVLPCHEQDKYWTDKQKKQYNGILARADKIIYISEQYHKGCMFQRNRYLVDSATCLLAFLEHETGGTKYTVDYAEKKGIKICYLHPEPFQLSFCLH